MKQLDDARLKLADRARIDRELQRTRTRLEILKRILDSGPKIPPGGGGK